MTVQLAGMLSLTMPAVTGDDVVNSMGMGPAFALGGTTGTMGYRR